MAKERILTSFKEQEEISQRVLDTQVANWSKIRTWQGKVIITTQTIAADKEKETSLTKPLKYEVDFAIDVVNKNKAWENRFLENSYHNSKESSFVHNETYYHLTTAHTEEGGNPARLLHIFATPSGLVVDFDPFEESIPCSQFEIKYRFSTTILEPRMVQRKNLGIAEEENEKYRQEVLANGFKECRFKLDGNIFTREYIHKKYPKEVFIVNFAQGGNIPTYKTFSGVSSIFPDQDPTRLIRNWEATYQKISNVWVPKKTKYSEVMGDGSLMVKEIEWIDQKINKKIPEERFTMKGIGAYQGISGVDHRIGGKGFTATGDEYPPEYEIPTPAISYVRWAFMGVGLLLILFGSISLICKFIKRMGAKQ